LAHMDKQLSIGSSDFAFAGIVDPGVAAPSARGDYFSVGLSDADYLGGRNMEARSASENLWDRQILERLLSTVGVEKSKMCAGKLIGKYGSLLQVLLAAEQRKIDGSLGMLLMLVVDTHKAILDSKLRAKPVLASSQAVIEYLTATMAHLLFEQVRVLFLGLTNKLIADKIVSTGTIDEAPIYPREIVKHALDLGATGLIIAHNHPSGDPRPSTDDIRITKRLTSVCREINIEVHDHIIIASDGWTSMRANGFI
jgi:DNA repair protein RadC